MTVDQNVRRQVARAELTRRAFIVGAAFLTAALVGALLTLTLAIRSTQLEGTPTGQKLVRSADRILDCTDPNGDCFKQSQARTADVVAALNLGALYGAYCVQQNPDASIPQIKACVKRLYDADQKTGE